MEEIAIISDIHGNLEALTKTLEDIKRRNIKKIYCLGDIIGKGVHNHECLELVKKNSEIVLLGNWEDFINKKERKNNLEETRFNFVSNSLTIDDLEYLKKLPYYYDFYLSGRLVRIYHASPTEISKTVLSTSNIDEYYQQFLPSEKIKDENKPDIIIYGHLHIPFMEKIYNRILINTGSVGNSFDVNRDKEKDATYKNTTVSNYLIIKGVFNSKDLNDNYSYEFVNINYDINKELESGKDNIEFQEYEDELRYGIYRETKNKKEKC